MKKWRIEAIEQPISKRNFKGFKILKKISPFPIYADESAKTQGDVKKLIRINAIDGIVVKIAKSGLFESMEMVRLARQKNKKVMISCMAESAAGLTTSILWAIADGKFNWVDLDSHLLTKSTIPHQYYRAQGPYLMPSSK